MYAMKPNSCWRYIHQTSHDHFSWNFHTKVNSKWHNQITAVIKIALKNIKCQFECVIPRGKFKNPRPQINSKWIEMVIKLEEKRKTKITWGHVRRRMSRGGHRPLRPAVPRDRALESPPSAASLSLECDHLPFLSSLCELALFPLGLAWKKQINFRRLLTRHREHFRHQFSFSPALTNSSLASSLTRCLASLSCRCGSVTRTPNWEKKIINLFLTLKFLFPRKSYKLLSFLSFMSNFSTKVLSIWKLNRLWYLY